MAKAGYTAVISHRSGKRRFYNSGYSCSCECWPNQNQGTARTDRVAKYNQLLRIEDMLGSSAQYLGEKVFYNLGK